jgi:dTMP kinase
VFLTLEGPEGSGKTSQACLLVQYLRGEGYEVLLTREPGGTPIGDQIRAVLHDPDNTAMVPRAEFLLYSASRAQLVQEVIRPALAGGTLVVCDRYYDSSLAYQGYGRGLDLATLQQVTRFAIGDLVPDLTVCLDIAPEEGLQRRLLGGEEWNRLDREALEFHRRVRAGYLELAASEPGRWVVVDASRSVEEVQAEIRMLVRQRLENGR